MRKNNVPSCIGGEGMKERIHLYEHFFHHYYIDEQDGYISNTLQMKDKCGRQEKVEVGGHHYDSNILIYSHD